MDTNEIREKVQDLIIEGKLQDAAEQIIEFLDSGVMNKKDKALFQLYNQSIHQISQLNELKNAKLSGIIDPDDADRKRNQIRMALLDINSRIRDLKDEKDPGVIPQPITGGTGNGGSGKSKILYVVIGILAAGLIGLGVLFFTEKNNIPGKAEVKKIPKLEDARTQPDKTNNSIADRRAEEEKRKREKEAQIRRAAEEEERKKQAEEARRKKEAGSITDVKLNPDIKLNPSITKIRPELVEALKDDFTRLTFDKIKSYKSRMRMSSIDGYTELKKGSILVYKAGTGRYGKLEVLEIGQNLKIRATTYNSSGTIRKSTTGLLIKGTNHCDLDTMLMTRSGMDFQWEIQSSSKRYLRPRDQAIFYQIK